MDHRKTESFFGVCGPHAALVNPKFGGHEDQQLGNSSVWCMVVESHWKTVGKVSKGSQDLTVSPARLGYALLWLVPFSMIMKIDDWAILQCGTLKVKIIRKNLNLIPFFISLKKTQKHIKIK